MTGRIRKLLFRNTSQNQTIAKNTFWLFSGEITARIIRAVIVIYGANLLGAANYGAFSYAMAIAGFVTIFSDIGLSQILTREVAKDPASRGQYLSTALFLKAILILINISLVIFIAPLFTKMEAARALLPLVAFILVFDTLRDFAAGLFRAMEKMELEALAKICTNAAVATAGFVLLLKAATAYSFAFAYVLGTGTGFIITLILIWPYVRGAFAHFNRSLIKTIVVAAWPIGLLSLLGTIMLNTDMVMLGWMRSPAEVGFYAAAQKPILLLYILPTLIASAIFPIMARLAHQDDTRFRAILERGIAATLLLALPLVVGGVVLRAEIFQLFFRSEYIPAIPVFGILLFTLLLVFPTAILNNSILAYNRQKLFLRFFAVGAASNIALNALLIPPYGVIGAAFATVGSQIFSTWLMFRSMKKINPFRVFSQTTRFLIASILMGGLVYLLRLWGVPFLANLAAGVIAYFSLLFLLKEPLINEMKRFLKGA